MDTELNEINKDLDSVLKRMTAYKNKNYCSLKNKELLDELTEGARYIHMGILKVAKVQKLNQEQN